MTDQETYERLQRIALYVAIGSFCLFSISPIYWMFKGSFETSADLLDAHLVPDSITLDNYRGLVLETNFRTFLRNSVVVSIGTTLLSVTLAMLAGYGLARFRFAGQTTIARSVLFTQMFPALALGIPLFILFQKAGLINSAIGLIIAHSTTSLPFGIWLMWQFFQTVPRAYEESAFTLGASRLRTFVEVELPLASPGLIAVAIFAFALSWEEYTFSLLLTTSVSAKTLPVGMTQFVERDIIHWGLIQSAGVFMAIPALLIVLLFQRYLIRGLGTGGLKG